MAKSRLLTYFSTIAINKDLKYHCFCNSKESGPKSVLLQDNTLALRRDYSPAPVTFKSLRLSTG